MKAFVHSINQFIPKLSNVSRCSIVSWPEAWGQFQTWVWPAIWFFLSLYFLYIFSNFKLFIRMIVKKIARNVLVQHCHLHCNAWNSPFFQPFHSTDHLAGRVYRLSICLCVPLSSFLGGMSKSFNLSLGLGKPINSNW